MITEEQKPLLGQVTQLSLEALATAKIFGRRERVLRLRMRALTWFGIAVPLAVGIVVMGFGSSAWPQVGTWIASGFLGLQLIVSSWAVVDRWEEKLHHAQESNPANLELYRRAKLILAQPGSDLERQLTSISADYHKVEQGDERQSVSDAEKSFGHRQALNQENRKCTRCERIPGGVYKHKEEEACPVCGNFSNWRMKI